MEYFLQLLEALDEYEILLESEPITGSEDIQDWCRETNILERRIEWLTATVKELEEPLVSCYAHQ